MKLKTISYKNTIIIILIVLIIAVISLLINITTTTNNNRIYISINNGEYIFNSFYKDNQNYIVIPNYINEDELEIHYYIKNPLNIVIEKNTVLCSINSDSLEIITNHNSFIINIIKSDLPNIYIQLNNIDLDQINSNSKEIKYKNNLLIYSDINNIQNNFKDDNIELKGRGNSSWNYYEKKSYQFKLSKKKNILNMGEAKTWILISNYADLTLMRNKLAYDLAIDLGMNYAQNSEWIDLWINGDYLGNYLLVEKIQVHENRVNLTDYKGIIAEVDMHYYHQENIYFKTNISNSMFVLHDSVANDLNTDNSITLIAFNDFKNYINQFEEELYKPEKSFNKIASYIDIDSFVKYYFINEFTQNLDSTTTSMFFYKDGDTDVLHIGPVWDFDAALGNIKPQYIGQANEDYILSDKYLNLRDDRSIDWYKQLFKIKEFKDIIIEKYNNEIRGILLTYINKLDDYYNKIKNSLYNNYNRWYDKETKIIFSQNFEFHDFLGSIENEEEYLKDWIMTRIEYMDQRYKY